MVLYLIGLGLRPDNISKRALEIIHECSAVYLETYTSILPCSHDELEQMLGIQVIPADRQLVERDAETKLLKPAKTGDVALLVIGDPLSATTHTDLLLRARELDVRTEVIHNATVLNAVARTGLQLYKFGKTASIAFGEQDYVPETHSAILKENQSINAHTLFLLDLRPLEKRYLTIADGITSLLSLAAKDDKPAFTDETLCVGCARLGWQDEQIVAGKAIQLLDVDFGKPPYCLIVPAKMHFVEEELIGAFASHQNKK
jgi:diphthine synthase